MSKTKIIIFIFSLALLLTGLSLFFKADDTLFGSVSSNTITRGFPFHFYESHYANGQYENLVFVDFLWSWLLGNILFYTIIIWSIWYLIKFRLEQKKRSLIIIAVVLAAILFKVSYDTPISCVSGFPIEFYLVCWDTGDVDIGLALFGFVFDFLFWLCLSSAFVSVLHIFYSSKGWKWKFLSILTAPIILTLMSLVFYSVCLSWICLFPDGRGFPLSFYGDGEWMWKFFGIDLIIWFILYLFFVGIYYGISRKHVQQNKIDI